MAIKPLFGLPRPPGGDAVAVGSLLPVGEGAAYAAIATAEGFGFPSGHALNAALVWGGLAWAIRLSSPRRRTVAAAVVVVLVSVSRLVLGVHYLIDVVVGAGLGGLILPRSPGGTFARRLSSVWRRPSASRGSSSPWWPPSPRPSFPALAVTAGLCAGGALSWSGLSDRLRSPPTRAGALATAAIGTPVGGVALGAGLLLTPSAWLAGAAGVVAGGAVVGAPAAGERVAARLGGR